jgi:DNA-nicking Smr family endonuclease
MGTHHDLPHPLNIDGILDLHAFAPREVPDLVREYLRVCRAQHVLHLRIVHGKCKGVIKKIKTREKRKEKKINRK